MFKWVGSFFRFVAGVLSDKGEPSSSRVGYLSVVWTGCFCAIYLIVKTKQIPTNLGILTAFVATIVGVIYGLNNGKSAAVSIFGKDDTTPPQPPANP